jgi:hypothetical protein
MKHWRWRTVCSFEMLAPTYKLIWHHSPEHHAHPNQNNLICITTHYLFHIIFPQILWSHLLCPELLPPHTHSLQLRSKICYVSSKYYSSFLRYTNSDNISIKTSKGFPWAHDIWTTWWHTVSWSHTLLPCKL